jgi:PleD family two-component response regulator
LTWTSWADSVAGNSRILLPNTEVNEAIPVAERVRAAIARISIPSDNGTVQFAASVGASQASPD